MPILKSIKDFWINNKGKTATLINFLPTGAIGVPLETIKGSTLDGIPLKGINRLAYVFLSATKIPAVILFLSPLIGLELNELIGWAKFIGGIGFATLWQIIYLGHKFAMNPDSVVDFMKNRNHRMHTAVIWMAKKIEKLNLVYVVVK